LFVRFKVKKKRKKEKKKIFFTICILNTHANINGSFS